MSVFYPIKMDNASFLATALVWQAETGITNNTTYSRAFRKFIASHTSQGVRITSGNTVNLGLIENKTDLITNPKSAIALAPALREACLAKKPIDYDDSEREIIDVHVSIMPDGKFYACGYQRTRNLFDLVLTQDPTQAFNAIAEELCSLILMPSDEFDIALHTTRLDKAPDEKRASDLTNHELTELLEEAIDSSHEYMEGHLSFFSKTHHLDTLIELLETVPATSLLQVTDISKLARAKLNVKQLVGLGCLIVACAGGYFFLSGPSSKTPDQATVDKYANFQPIEAPVVSTPTVQEPVYDPTEDKGSLEKMINEERRWLETYIRMNGHRPFNTLYSAISEVPMEVVGFSIESVSYADPFTIEENSLSGELISRYLRKGDKTINDFLKVFPEANFTLDGNIGLVTTEFSKSSHERPYEYRSEKLDLESLISRLQIMEREGVLTNWALRKTVTPSRPEKYTLEEESLLSRLKLASSEDDNQWLQPFDVYTVTIDFKFSNKLPRLSVVFDDYHTAVLTKLHYQISTQIGALEVQVYDF